MRKRASRTSAARRAVKTLLLLILVALVVGLATNPSVQERVRRLVGQVTDRQTENQGLADFSAALAAFSGRTMGIFSH